MQVLALMDAITTGSRHSTSFGIEDMNNISMISFIPPARVIVEEALIRYRFLILGCATGPLIGQSSAMNRNFLVLPLLFLSKRPDTVLMVVLRLCICCALSLILRFTFFICSGKAFPLANPSVFVFSIALGYRGVRQR